MSLLDRVRLAATRYDNLRTRWEPDPRGEGTVLICVGCGRMLHEHASDCVFTLMPKIVAALEAGERVVFRASHPETDRPGQRGYVNELKALATVLKDTA